jgi:hypothetical protein
MTTIKPVFVELKRPSGNHPGHVLEGFFAVENVRLVDRDGAAVKDAQGATYSRKLTANENPKSVAHRLLRTHYSATRHKTVNGFDGPIFYPKMKRV